MGRSHESGWEAGNAYLWPAGFFVGELSSPVGNLSAEEREPHDAFARDRDCIVWAMCGHAARWSRTAYKFAYRRRRPHTALYYS